MEKEKRQQQSTKKKEKRTHLSPHNRHLSLKHGFVKTFICLQRKTITCVIPRARRRFVYMTTKEDSF